MKQVNNYLKKGTLILAIIMLLAIPNLPVYSSIGSYQTSSSAITANKNYMSFAAANGTTIDMIADLLTNPSVSLRLALPVEVVEQMLLNYDMWIAELQTNRAHGLPSASKPISKPYAKYDFSGFDN